MEVTAIVPVKDRDTVRETGRSLLAVPDLHLLLCDGGSTTDAGRAAIADLLDDPRSPDRISYVCIPQSGFNKSQLLNAGLERARSPWILLSDADILWQPSAVANLLAGAQSGAICTVAQVRERDPTARVLGRSRRTYRLDWRGDAVSVRLVADPPESAPETPQRTPQRPGCGLLCASKTVLQAIGGFKERFCGWGWEDRDLLLRAELLGARVTQAGRVLHCSHGDDRRNRFAGGLEPLRSRDRNIALSLAELQQGRLWGDWWTDARHRWQPRVDRLEVEGVTVGRSQWQRWLASPGSMKRS